MSILVQYRYYAFDDGHHHWTDDYESFATVTDAEQFIAELDRRIADGDTNVRPGRIVDDVPSYGRRRTRTAGPL